LQVGIEEHNRIPCGHVETGTVSRLLTKVAAETHQQPIWPRLERDE
jgi:hypothetical protein